MVMVMVLLLLLLLCVDSLVLIISGGQTVSKGARSPNAAIDTYGTIYSYTK